MTSKRFLLTALTTLLAGLGLVIGTSYVSNAYGLFGDVGAEPLRAYRGERTTKYLFGYNYVPKNFDSLLVGASISLNWNTKRISGARIYNASISGANLYEEGLIADQVMQRRRLKWLVIALHPYLTMTHGRRTEYMTPREYWSAFGSINTFFLESTKLLAERGLLADQHNEYGDSNYVEGLSGAAARVAMDKYIADRKKSGKPSRNFVVAPGALEDLTTMITRARKDGTRVLVIYPPVYWERFQVESADWEAYWAKIGTLLPADVSPLNFNTPRFDALRRDLANFQDSGHLSRQCADAIVDEVGHVVAEASTP